MPSSPLCKKLQVQKSCPIKGRFSIWILDSLAGIRSREVQLCGAPPCARGLFTLSSLIIPVVTLRKETCKGIHREGTSGKQACSRYTTNLPPSSPSTYMLKVSFDTFLFWPCISFPLHHKNTSKPKTSMINQTDKFPPTKTKTKKQKQTKLPPPSTLAGFTVRVFSMNPKFKCCLEQLYIHLIELKQNSSLFKRQGNLDTPGKCFSWHMLILASAWVEMCAVWWAPALF